MIAARRIRWSDEDSYFGPLLYALDKYRNIALVLGSGDDDEHPGCRLRMSAFGHTMIVSLPPIVKPWKKKVIVPEWNDNGTAARLGRDFYFDSHSCEYGFSYSGSGSLGDGGFLQVFLGPQTMDSSTTKSWSCFTPWNNWRHVRHSFYDIKGYHFWTASSESNSLMGKDGYQARQDAQNACPAKTFQFADFDGEIIECKTRIEEREWRLGTGWFKWLSRFKKPIIHRSLVLEFSEETGRRKGSWKGGTMGHSIEMEPRELHEAAFRRYCEGDDRREGKRDMKFIGEV